MPLDIVNGDAVLVSIHFVTPQNACISREPCPSTGMRGFVRPSFFPPGAIEGVPHPPYLHPSPKKPVLLDTIPFWGFGSRSSPETSAHISGSRFPTPSFLASTFRRVYPPKWRLGPGCRFISLNTSQGAMRQETEALAPHTHLGIQLHPFVFHPKC